MLLFWNTWFLGVTESVAALVQLASIGRTQRLAANPWVAVIGNLPSPMWLWQVKAGERVVFAQRMCCPIHRHQDTAQVGMACESDAEKVVHFALVPVSSWPDTYNGW